MILNYEGARRLAQTRIELENSDAAQVLDEFTVTKPYGWVFVYKSKEYLGTRTFSDQLLGNCPIFIDKINGELRLIPTSKSIDQWLDEFEQTVPTAWLNMKPEHPKLNETPG